MKKMPGDLINLKKGTKNCTKNHGHMLYCSWNVARHECNCYFSFWPIFYHFTPITASKMKISKKWKKAPGDLINLKKGTKNYDHIVYRSWEKVRDRYNCYFSFWAIFCPFTP